MSNDIFAPETKSFFQMMVSSTAGGVGYRIPAYQRTYDWDESNIHSLIGQCLSGFERLSNDEEADSPTYTFLGNVILVNEDQEFGHGGASYEIIDGQQRLTTLALMACALISVLDRCKDDIDKNLGGLEQKWLEREIDAQILHLIQCIRVSQITGPETMEFFPKIVRTDDTFGPGFDTEYKSSISILLDHISKAYNAGTRMEHIEPPNGSTGEHIRFYDNYIEIKLIMMSLSDEWTYEKLEQGGMAKRDKFSEPRMRNLFKKLSSTYSSDSGIDEALQKCINNLGASQIMRTILFSAYLMDCVLAIVVQPQNQSYAFDVFDSLNTTGEPLTALETLKPLVVNHEETDGDGYEGSKSQGWFENIKKCLDDKYPNKDTRQKEIKEFITSLAIYWEGIKLPGDLKSQRDYLRSKYSRFKESELKDEFIKSISDFAEFRNIFWDGSNIEDLLIQDDFPACPDSAKLGMSFIFEMKTKLCLPILARYWINNRNDHKSIASVIRYLAAFLAIRRAATGGTDNIDSSFRSVMSKSYSGSDPLCAGITNTGMHTNELWQLDTLKNALLSELHEKFNGPIEKSENWLRETTDQPLADKSKSLCKFLLLAAANRTTVITEGAHRGLWEKDTGDSSKRYLSYDVWKGDNHKALEHVAPEKSNSSWSNNIYSNKDTIHSLGNLLALPLRDNIDVRKLGWEDKQGYYLALANNNEQHLTAYKVPAKVRRQITEISMLNFVTRVDSWNLQFIQNRSKNIAELARQELLGWLDS